MMDWCLIYYVFLHLTQGSRVHSVPDQYKALIEDNIKAQETQPKLPMDAFKDKKKKKKHYIRTHDDDDGDDDISAIMSTCATI